MPGQAIETGTEQITAGLLDALTVSPADLPGLDPDARRGPRHSPGTRPPCPETAQAAEDCVDDRAPRRRDRGLTGRCPSPGRCPGA